MSSKGMNAFVNAVILPVAVCLGGCGGDSPGSPSSSGSGGGSTTGGIIGSGGTSGASTTGSASGSSQTASSGSSATTSGSQSASGSGSTSGGASASSSGSASGSAGSGTASGSAASGSASSGTASGSASSGTASGSATSGAASGSASGSGSGTQSASSGSSTSGSASSGSSGTVGQVLGVGPNCGSGDPNLAGIEPSWPTVCQQITSTTANVQAALTACAGKGAVKLTGTGASYTTGALTIPGGTFLWVDTGVTVFPTAVGSRATIETSGNGAGIVGGGTIDGSKAPSGSTMIHSATNNFVMYKINLRNSQKMHVKVQGDHFVIWGTTLITPPTAANTDGIDPGAGQSGVATTNGYIVCNTISVGDDQIAIKGLQGHLSGLVVAHNAFGAGHGMSIGSETGGGGIDGVQVYDLTIDGDVYPGAKAVNANGIRIKSYSGAGGVVDHVQYDNICGRNLSYAIRIDPNYTSGTVTGGGTPDFRNLSIKSYHVLKGSGSQTPTTMINGTGKTAVTLDDVVIDGLASMTVGSGATVTVGSGGASPAPAGASGGSPNPVDCSQRFIAFPVHY